jgi:hypothetical protein
MDLPNFAWESFWMPGIAHALLLGVVKDVMQLLFRQKQHDLRHGTEYFISKETRKRMLSLVKQLAPTSGYPRGFTTILACVPSLCAEFHRHNLLCMRIFPPTVRIPILVRVRTQALVRTRTPATCSTIYLRNRSQISTIFRLRTFCESHYFHKPWQNFVHANPL